MSRRTPSDGTHSRVTALPSRVATRIARLSSQFSPGFSDAVDWLADDDEVRDPPLFEDLPRPKENRIQEIIERNGGRIHQSDIVASSDWSASTISRVLREMEQAGDVVRIRDGREKVVCHPERLPDGIEVDSSGEARDAEQPTFQSSTQG